MTHPHISVEWPGVRSIPPRPDKTYWASWKSETGDLDEEDGHLAVCAYVGLDLQPLGPPTYPSLLDAVAPERGTSLFLSLGRFRC